MPTGSSAWCGLIRGAKPQSGISFLLIDMKSPGVTVRPIITIDGSHEVNDVFLEDVRVPVENLIGEENKGWTYAKFLLGNERTGMAFGIDPAQPHILLDRLKKDCEGRECRRTTQRISNSLQGDEAASSSICSRSRPPSCASLPQMARGIDPGPAASLFKISGTEIFQEFTEADTSRHRQ